MDAPHEIFVQTIAQKVKIYSRLKELDALPFVKYGNDLSIEQSQLREDADTALKDIENSIRKYLQENTREVEEILWLL